MSFLSTKLPMANGNYVEKMTIFIDFFFFTKMSSFWQIFDSQMAIFRRVRCTVFCKKTNQRLTCRTHCTGSGHGLRVVAILTVSLCGAAARLSRLTLCGLFSPSRRVEAAGTWNGAGRLGRAVCSRATLRARHSCQKHFL